MEHQRGELWNIIVIVQTLSFMIVRRSAKSSFRIKVKKIAVDIGNTLTISCSVMELAKSTRYIYTEFQ